MTKFGANFGTFQANNRDSAENSMRSLGESEANIVQPNEDRSDGLFDSAPANDIADDDDADVRTMRNVVQGIVSNLEVGVSCGNLYFSEKSSLNFFFSLISDRRPPRTTLFIAFGGICQVR
jgi:hypothetical protein